MQPIIRSKIDLDEGRLTRWLASICDEDFEEKEHWDKLLIFLDKEMKLQQQKALLQGEKTIRTESSAVGGTFTKNTRYKHSYFTSDNVNDKNDLICHICGESSNDSEHVATIGPGGTKVVQYFSCKVFVNKTPAERFALLRRKNLCFQCLLPGADASIGKHKEGKCQHDFTCKHVMHKSYQSKKHILVCEEHKFLKENIELLDMYKQRCMKNPNILSFSRNIKLSFHSDAYYTTKRIDEDVNESGIYLLQAVKIENEVMNVFYDNGCSDCIIKHDATKKLKTSAVQVYKGSISVGGVGNNITESNHGIYSLKIPLYNGQIATLSGICLDKITSDFPIYPLADVERELHESYKSIGGNLYTLPKLAKSVGGEADIMLGVKYLRYHPKPIFQLPSGLCIYESMFDNADGGRGVVGGPHKIFTEINRKFYNSNVRKSFFTHQRNLINASFNIDPDVSLLGFKSDIFNSNQISDCDSSNDQSHINQVFHSSNSKHLHQSEEVGNEISYRCINCRNCQACKYHHQIEAISIKEEVEQDVINKSVSVDINNHVISTYLPFVQNPNLELALNKEIIIIFNSSLLSTIEKAQQSCVQKG